MKLKNIFKDKHTKIFKVINDDVDNELDMEIEPTDLELIPDDDNGYYIIRAIEILGTKTTACFIDMNTPERVTDIAIKKGLLGSVKISYTYESEIIPSVASDCFGLYELYYSKSNPDLGIQILRNGLSKAVNKNIVAEDLGYILRDEGRIQEAIEAFKISEEFGSSTEYTFLELSYLYEELGDMEKKEHYFKAFTDRGGKIINIS